MTIEEALKVLRCRSGWNLSIRDANALDMAIKALEQQPCNAISRQAANDIVRHECGEWKGLAKEIVKQFNGLPPVQPKYNPDEWCHDCKEYDHDKHCCPRHNGVIRKVVEEIKQPKIKVGHWIDIPKYKDIAWQCSECEYFTTLKHSYCPNCGAKMVEPQESEDKE